MPESKGRSGKKPKYQIADIGGADLTSEDISTERVLNFLIKGEIGSVGQHSLSEPRNVKAEPRSAVTQRPEAALLSEASKSDPAEPLVKKSLSHLFERAGGTPGTGRDFNVQSNEIDPAAVPFPVEDISGETFRGEPVTGSEPELSAVSVDIGSGHAAPVMSAAAAATPGSIPTPASSTPSELPSGFADQADRWKNLYRLNSGEIAALKTLCLLAGEDGRSECFVKMRKLAELSSLDYRYCQKVVRSLERLGWITKLLDYDASTQLGVLYRINSRPVHLT